MSKNYDDLDDLLDEFDDVAQPASPKVAATQSAAVSEEPKPKTSQTSTQETTAAACSEPLEDVLAGMDEDFAQKLNLGVDDLVGAMESDPAAREMLASLVASLTSGQQPDKASKGKAAKGAEPVAKTFEETIAQTMGRLNESQEEEPTENEDFLQSMLKELSAAAGGGATGDDSDIGGLIDGLMEELSSKDVLYEPIKDLHDRFPAWLSQNQDKLQPSELERYKAQQSAARAMVLKFEESTYSDDSKECRKFITACMEDLQSAGAPPQELVGSLPGGAIPGAPAPGADNCIVM